MTPYKTENNTEIERKLISTNILVSENRLNQTFNFNVLSYTFHFYSYLHEAAIQQR